MAALKEIKERINSVSATRKITSAMKLVSAAKLSRAQRNITEMLPYSNSLNDIFRKAINAEGDFDTPLASQREVRHIAVVAFSSDSSLAGAFNSNVIRELRRVVDAHKGLGSENIYIYTVGKKVYEVAQKWECPIVENFTNLASKPDYGVMADLAMRLIDRYLNGEVDQVVLIYQHFKSTGSQLLTTETLLPMTMPEKEAAATGALPYYIFEPSREDILHTLLPKSFKLKLYTVLLDSNASEHAARVIAMQIATDNANQLVDELTLQYNKSRQQAITSELLDIMGGKV